MIMQRHFRYFIGLLLFWSLSIQTYAANWYINDNSLLGDIYTSAIGNDGTGNGSKAQPYLTVGFVVSNKVLAGGDTVFIDAGDYSALWTFNSNVDGGSAGNQLVIQGAGAALTKNVWNGGQGLVVGNGAGAGNSYITFNDLYVETTANAQTVYINAFTSYINFNRCSIKSSVSGGAMTFMSANNCAVISCDISTIYDGINCYNGSNHVYDGNTITQRGGYTPGSNHIGILITGTAAFPAPQLADNCMISSNRISGFNFGLDIQEEGINNTWKNNYVWNSEYGIFCTQGGGGTHPSNTFKFNSIITDKDCIFGTTLNWTIVNNILYTLGGAGYSCLHLQTSTHDPSTLNYNLYYAPTGKIVNRNGSTYATLALWKPVLNTDANSLSGNPLFISNSNLDITLPSPAVNKALTDLSVTDDVRRPAIVRPTSKQDIGAFEIEFPCGDTTLSPSIPNRCTGATNFNLNDFIGSADPGSWSIFNGPVGYTATVGVDGHTFNCNNSAGGIYTVRHTLSTVVPTCPAFADRTFTLYSLPTVTLVLSDALMCTNEATQAITTASPLGGTFSGSGVSGNNYDPSLTAIGPHTITYTYTDGNFCANSANAVMTVADTTVVTLILADDKICVNEAPQAITVASPVGGTFSGSGVNGNNYDPSAASIGTHKITYTFSNVNSCISKANDDVTVLDTTAVSLILADDKMCINETPQAITIANPAGGTFSGSGVSGNNYAPSLTTAGIHTITYAYTDANTCTSKASDVMTVLDTTAVSLILADDKMCVNEAAQAITVVSPTGGTFSGSGVNGNNYDPSSTTVGAHTITYALPNANTCTSKASDVMTVFDTTAVTLILADDKMCINEASQTITVVSITGGVLSGSGVSGNNYDPSSTTAGAHTITYTFSNANSCISAASDIMTVLDTTALSLILADDKMCVNEAPQAISVVNIAGGIFSGSGVSGNNYDPSATTAGAHTIKYTFVDANTCTSVASDIMNVLDTTAVTLILSDDKMCVNEAPQAITVVSVAGGTLSGSGVSGNNYDPSTTTIGAHTVTYTFTNANTCTSKAIDVMTVIDTTNVSLILADHEMCRNEAPQTIAIASPTGGVFTGNGVSGDNYNPGSATAGPHIITYTFVNVGNCSSKATDVITVLDTSAASLFLSDHIMCKNEAPQAINIASPAGGTFSGSGVSGNNYDPNNTSIGAHAITYTFNNLNSCTSKATAVMTVIAIPAPAFAKDTVKSCFGKTVTLDPGTSHAMTYLWNPSGNTPTISFNANTSGTYTVNVNDNGCSASASVYLQVDTLPHVDLGKNTTLCNNNFDKLTLSANSPNAIAIQWSTNEQNVPTIVVMESGLYYVNVTNSLGCVNSDSITVSNYCEDTQLEWPNVITTNEDGKNDVFKAKGIDDSNVDKYIANLTFINFQVYDRWGVLVFGSQEDVLPNWDGKYQGIAVPSGTYYYIIRYQNTAKKSYEVLGYITLLQ